MDNILNLIQYVTNKGYSPQSPSKFDRYLHQVKDSIGVVK